MKIDKKLIKKNLSDIENNFKNLNDEYYLELIQKAVSLIVNSIKKKKKKNFLWERWISVRWRTLMC